MTAQIIKTLQLRIIRGFRVLASSRMELNVMKLLLLASVELLLVPALSAYSAYPATAGSLRY